MQKKKQTEKKISEYDVSMERDWALLISNEIEAEKHLQETYAETKDERYLVLISEIREIRGRHLSEFLKKFNKQFEKKVPGLWCTFKHLLSACMESSEVATKHLDNGETEKASQFFTDSQEFLKIIILINEFT